MLTKRQKQVLDFIKSYKEKHVYAPSLEEIKDHLNLSSVSTAHYHVHKLEKSGYLKKENNQARSIGVRDNIIINKQFNIKKKTSFSVPIYGMANAGPATIFAEENIYGYIKIPSNLHIAKNGIFAVLIHGDSMNMATIGGKRLKDGNFALIDSKYKVPHNGDYVLSIIDGCANLKKFNRDKKTKIIKLTSESTNKNHKPIYISSEDDYMVNGKVIAVLNK